MKRDMFGTPRPKGHAEMVEALDERNFDGSDCYAMLAQFYDSESEEDGWSAAVMGSEDGEEVFNTLGYGDDKAALIADLKASGIHDIQY